MAGPTLGLVAVNVYVSDPGVDIRFDGLDAAWTLRRRLHIPVEQLVAARVERTDVARRELGWRLGGTYLPGVIAAGRYTFRPSRDGERQLWCVYRDPEVLVIDTSAPVVTRVVLQHPDRHDLAWWIGERVAAQDADS